MTQQAPLDRKEIERRYREEFYPLYEEFVERVHGLLKELALEFGTLIEKIEYRVKTVDSFLEKIERRGYTHPFEEIHDCAGLRIITFYQDSVPHIVELIRKEFVVDAERSHDKFDILEVDEFGYRSIHLLVSLPHPRAELKEWKRFTGLQAEIQIRSILQHAWATMSHKFDYKATAQAPKELRRRLFRLSALLELADEEFRALTDQSAEITQGYRHDVSRGEFDLPLDLDSLREYLHQRVDLPTWEELGIAAGMEPFPDPAIARKYFSTGLEILLLTLQTIGKTSIADFQRLLPELRTLQEPLQKFVHLIHSQGETVHALPVEVLILLTTFSNPASIPEQFNWGGKYKPFYIEVLHEVCHALSHR